MNQREQMQHLLEGLAFAIDEVAEEIINDPDYVHFPHVMMNRACKKMFLITQPTIGETVQ